MTRYTQRDTRWSNMSLGTSPFSMGGDGCYVTSCAQILTLAGYAVTPGDLCQSLDSDGGFTTNGLAEWAGVTNAYPQFHYDGSGTYRLVQMRKYNSGSNSYDFHYYATDPSGIVYDPWTGTDQHPAGFADTGAYTAISCASNPLTIVLAVEPTNDVALDFWVELDSSLHVRSHPSLSAPIVETYPTGSVIECKGVVPGDSINGNVLWYVSKRHGYYFTSAYSHQIATSNI